MIGTRTFTEIAAKYATTMGRQGGVRVVFKGNVGMTDGKVIVLPTMPAGTVLTPHEEKVYGGYLDHETGHIRWSDWSLVREISKKDQLKRDIHNMIEDVRQENCHIQEYPGAKGYLDALTWEVDQKSRTQRPKEPTYAQQVVSLLYKEVWAKYRNCDTLTVDGWLEDHDELRPLVEILAAGFAKMETAKDAMILTNKVVDFLRSLLPPPSTGGDSSEETKSVGGKGNAEVKSKKGKSSKKELKKDGDGSDDQHESKPRTEGDDGRSEDESDGDGSDDPGEGEPSQDRGGKSQTKADLTKEHEELLGAIAEALETLVEMSDRTRTFNDLVRKVKASNGTAGAPDQKDNRGHDMEGLRPGQLFLPPKTMEFDRVLIPWAQQSKSTFDRERAVVSAEILATKKMLNIHLQTLKQKSWSRGLEEGRLDNEMLHTLMFGNRRVYKQLRDRQAMDTAVLLMLDLSSSMDSHIVRQTAILLSEACNGIQGLKLQICGFMTNTRSGYGDYGGSGNGGRSGIGRTVGIDIPIFKEFEEPYVRAQGRLGAIQTAECTPLAEGYGYGFEALVRRKERRKVLWMVSDGEPFYSYDDPRHCDWSLAKQIQVKCRKLRIDTMGLGIGSGRKLRNVVDRYAEISEVLELPAAVMKILKATIR